MRSARLPVNSIGSPINYANRSIGSPITSQSTADSPASAAAQRLFDYISGQNDKHVLINMTAPVLTWVVPGQGCVMRQLWTLDP